MEVGGSMYPLHGNLEMGTRRSARRLNCGNRADWVSHTRAIPPSFNSGWQVNSFPRAFSLPSRNGAIPRGKIDPFPGFPTGSAGSYITDGHLYISNSALRPASFESSIARLFDLPGIQICWLRTSYRLNGCYVRTPWLRVCRLSWKRILERREKKNNERVALNRSKM